MKYELNGAKVDRVIIDLNDNTVEFQAHHGLPDAPQYYRMNLNRKLKSGISKLRFAQTSPAGHALQAFLGWAKVTEESDY